MSASSRRHLLVPVALTGAAAVGAAAVLALASPEPPPSGPRPGDEAVLHRIEALRAPAAAIRADGEAADWAALPVLPDPEGDAGDDPALDLVGVALAPAGEGLHVLLHTAGPPTAADRAYWLDVDAGGAARADLQVGLSPDGEHWVRAFDQALDEPLRRARFPARVGPDAIEVTVPWEALEAWAPGVTVRGREARGWVRVVASTWERGSDRLTDVASAASYRLGPRTPALDPAPGEGEAPAAVLPLPVEGTWLVSQEALGARSHASVHAYDLTMTDGSLQAAGARGSCRNADYMAWERPVTAPAAGRARVVRTGESDRPPCRGGRSGEPNEVLLDLGDGLALRFLHLREGSAAVRPGERVRAGELLARVGSSGASSAPHLHVELVAAGGGGTRPLAFRDVRVGLNRGPDDPWARELPTWSPRAGYFVAPAEPATRP